MAKLLLLFVFTRVYAGQNSYKSLNHKKTLKKVTFLDYALRAHVKSSKN